MESYLQMTFLPQIKADQNFFVWLTDPSGRTLPVPDPDHSGSRLSAWLKKYFPGCTPCTADFITDYGTEKVSGLLVTMADMFHLFQENPSCFAEMNDLSAGETVQWFGKIAPAVQELVASGLFFPYFYHLEIGNRRYRTYIQWLPDGDGLVQSGLFNDWLSHLPEPAFAIKDLQDQKVRQWLCLILIYWTGAVIRSRKSRTLPLESEAFITDSAEATVSLNSGNPFEDRQHLRIASDDPEMIQKIDRLESEWHTWIQPALSPVAIDWIQTFLTFQKSLLDSLFLTEKAQIILTPENNTDPFNPASDWLFEILMTGRQGGRLLKQPLDRLNRTAPLTGYHWLEQHLRLMNGRMTETLLRKLSVKTEGKIRSEEMAELFQNRETLRQAAIELVFPDELAPAGNEDPLSIDLDLAPAQENPDSLFNLRSLINYNWRISIGDIELSADVFRRLVQENQSFIRHGNRWIHLPMEEMRKAYAEMDGASELLEKRAAVGGALKLETLLGRKKKSNLSIHLSGELKNYLNQLIKKPSKNIPLTDNFQGKLRPYQKKGFTWLINLRHRQVGGCLADDMGLGKTVQAIAYLAYCRERTEDEGSEPALIICPTSLVANWKDELQRFAPDLKTYIHHGSARLRGSELLDHLKQSDIMVTSYALYTKESVQLNSICWQSVILDEAQAIKNPQAQKTRALRHIQCGHRLVLTGTPIENRLEELWSIIDFLNPHYLGSLEQFRKQFIRPIEKKSSRSRIKELTRLIHPFLLRREKTDKRIIRDLPDKFEEKKSCFLTKQQASLYQSVVDRLALSVGKADGIRRKGLILSALTRLKQICDHPALVTAGGSEPQSGKLELFYDLLDPLFTKNQKILVFTQYVRMGKLLVRETSKRYPDADVFFLHGGLSGEKREELIRRFQTENGHKTLFVLSLKAGGFGINLTEAGYVFHYDRWWNPAVEEQATDRAYRIGQNKNIYVYKLICEGTLEERIDRLIDRKNNLQKQILESGESWLTEMSDQEIFQLIQLHEEVI